MVTLDSRLKPIDTVFVQKIDDEIVLFDSKNELYYGLDSIGSIMWEAIVEGDELLLVQKKLLDKFDIESKILERDLIVFVEKLIDNNLLKEKY